MRLYTIGFTQRSAEDFFGAIARSGAQRLVDVRLNNSSQLAGFSKRDDLRYFLKTICAIEYLRLPQLAPTQELLEAYRSSKDWATYKTQFRALLADRKVEDTVPREQIDGACLLCSEPKPDRCHRRLVAEYLQEKWGPIEIVHL
jgi:uncharacterized protein (DUF488 family)